MDAFEELRQAHVEAKSMFQQIEQASPDERGPLWARLWPQLLVHEQSEEKFVYGPVAEDAEGRDPILTGWDERHHQQAEEARRLIGEVGRLDSSTNQFLTRLGDLRITLERHIQEEEDEIWPRIRQVWDQKKLDQAGTQVQAATSAGAAGAAVSGAIGQVAESLKDTARRMAGS